MSESVKIIAAGALALAAGFVGGRLSAPTPPPAPAADPPRVQPAPPPEGDLAPDPAAPSPPRGPEAREADPASASHCQDAHVALRFMKASREAREAREAEIRRSFDDGSAIEEAMRWTKLAEDVLEQCLPETLELSFMECSEYPCAAVLAGPASASQSGEAGMEARDLLEFEAERSLEDCAPLEEVFGEDYPSAAASLLPFPVSCPEGPDEHAWVLLLLDPTGEAIDDLYAEPSTRDERARINRWIYRRAHTLDHKWICADEAPPPPESP